jgi:hypothetical protein
MPHKRNPVLTENLTGLSRTVRAYVTGTENVVLWHERDIRTLGRAYDGARRHGNAGLRVKTALAGVVEKPLVYPANMQKNPTGWRAHSLAAAVDGADPEGLFARGSYRPCSATPCRSGAAKATSDAAEKTRT